jgi:hypothetical protein
MVKCVFNLGKLSLSQKFYSVLRCTNSSACLRTTANTFLPCCPQRGELFHVVAYNANNAEKWSNSNIFTNSNLMLLYTRVSIRGLG